MDTGVRCCDFGHSKPNMVQDMTGVITVGHLATEKQINKLYYEFFTVFYNLDIYKLFIANKNG
jgi:hypothetical protein